MKIGFVGLGNMGFNMVKNLIRNGFEVYTYDVFPEAVERTIKIGAKGVKSLAELAEKAEIIQIMVMNYRQVESVVLGEEGLLAHMKEGSILNVSSTVSPAETRELSEKVLAKGLGYTDCPVSGGKDGAINGTLVIMAACADETYERIKDMLFAMGSHTYHVSTVVGNGQVMKSINQIMMASGMAVVAEAVTMGVKAGLDPEQIYEVICLCTGCYDVFRDKLPLIMERDFAPRGPGDIFIKDLSIALDIGKEVKSPMFISSLIKQIYIWSSSCGYGQDDVGALICAYEDCVGVKVQRKEA